MMGLAWKVCASTDECACACVRVRVPVHAHVAVCVSWLPSDGRRFEWEGARSPVGMLLPCGDVIGTVGMLFPGGKSRARSLVHLLTQSLAHSIEFSLMHDACRAVSDESDY